MFVANRAVPQRKPTMTEHTKTDGMPGMDLPVLPDSAALGLAKAPPRNERMSTAKVECNACPVLCQISDGRTGACDRYANRAGVLVRVDPVVLLRRELASDSPALVPFAREGAESVTAEEGAAPAPVAPDWDGDLPSQKICTEIDAPAVLKLIHDVIVAVRED